jgi:hypothetical protein
VGCVNSIALQILGFEGRPSLRTPHLNEGVGISFGVVVWSTDGPSKEMLLLRADVAMYSDKYGDEPPIASAAGDVSTGGVRDDDHPERSPRAQATGS